MSTTPILATRAQAQLAAERIEAINQSLGDDSALAALAAGLPHIMVEGIRRTLLAERTEAEKQLDLYNEVGVNRTEELFAAAKNDLGQMLVAARLSRDLSQKELARRLGKRPQEVQRWEASEYRSITLANFKRVQRVLGVEVHGNLRSSPDLETLNPSREELRKVRRHANENGWFFSKKHSRVEGSADQKPIEKNDLSDKSDFLQLIFDTLQSEASPALLRTGLSGDAEEQSLGHLAWKARVAEVASRQQGTLVKGSFDLNDYKWLKDLPTLSLQKDGPSQAVEAIRQRGIAVVFERNIPGFKVDGASFLLGDMPVIGMTLLRDTIDNFWFTLMHELGHIYLHYHVGLKRGFFDELDADRQVSKFEMEADEFAQELLIPSEIWRTSMARLATTEKPVERLAKRLKINPAIIFGRIRYEREDYSIFNKHIGRGTIRRDLTPNAAKG